MFFYGSDDRLRQVSRISESASTHQLSSLTSNSPRLLVCVTPGKASARFLWRRRNISLLPYVRILRPSLTCVPTPHELPKTRPSQPLHLSSHSLENFHRSRLPRTPRTRRRTLLPWRAIPRLLSLAMFPVEGDPTVASQEWNLCL
jgi:hypothetical protein